MKRTITTLVALLALAGSTALGQEPLRLTLEDAVKLAMNNNRGLQISRNTITNADQQIKEAYANVYPSVTLNGRYTRNIQRPVFYFPGADGITRPVSIGSDNAISTDITVNQIVFNSAVFTGVGAAETYAKISRQQLRSETSQAVLNTKRAYFTALLAQEALRVNQSLLANAEENFKNTQALYKAGIRAEFDAIRADVQAANQRPVVVQATDNYKAAIDNLRLILSLPADQPIELTEQLIRPISNTQVEPAVAEARQILERYNPQIETLRLTNEVNRQLIDIQRSDYYPTVSFFGTYQLQAQSDNFSGLEFQPTSYVGLNVSMNLFAGGKSDAKMAQARIQYEQTKLQLAQLSDALRTQLDGVLRTIEYARQRITASARTIEQAEKGYRIATTSYKAGTGTQLDINNADLALAQSRLNQLSAVYDYNIALAQLEGLLGEHVQITDDNNNVKYSVR